MRKKLGWIILGILIGLCVVVFRYDVRDVVHAAASHMDRLVLGSGNYGTDPNPTADLTFQNDEYITNATDGTLGFGAANLVTTGHITVGEAAHRDYIANVSISADSVKALNDRPQTLVSAPGSNYAVVFLDALVLLDYTAPGYGGVGDTEDLIISYTNTDADSVGEVVSELETTGFVDQTSDTWRYCTPSVGADGDDNAYIVPVPNSALVISLIDGEIITGGSTLDLAVHYKIVPTDL